MIITNGGQTRRTKFGIHYNMAEKESFGQEKLKEEKKKVILDTKTFHQNQPACYNIEIKKKKIQI